MTVNLNRLSHFVAVVESGSFTAAAERLGLAKAAVSHQVAQLEKELGTTLLARTTRRLSPTATGQRFYERAALILRDAEEAVGAVSAETEIPSGTLTLTAPLDYGAKVVTNAVAAYLDAYPAMRVDLNFNDTVLDMIENRLDLAIRAGWLIDSSERAKRIGTFEQYLVASPAYVTRLGQLSHPEHLAEAGWIANGALKTPLEWRFMRAGEETSVLGKALVTADSTDSAHCCAVAGIGVAVLPDYQVRSDIAEGRLLRLFSDWALPSGGIHVVYPPSHFRPARVRAFVEILQRMEKERGRLAG
ncbi:MULTISPECIES: LysR family transcriptional regulator [unclassified Ensifer]|uniref:LysR family transcriptional regulator n=1 Tax=unclassified Ensifer TaxID=2633371 RepID=UPI0008130BD6|nr:MULTISPECIES: LysR family transcriptional regulator [unclassified Ensifer]OCP01708.1 LysR family transcriptional regulator [Ensifer sp. LC14]OCP09496.1 LysR family transcriptional regulator [Ensifer sp. LC13]OCP10669.1 LysR family transcriptional regulator [Ensifer sp. LC11]OCP32745.1 LysR family transcriptional regulator [Ensifer sp. LC499]